MKRSNLVIGLYLTAGLLSAGAMTHAQEKPVVRFHEYGKIILHLPNWVMIQKGFCEKYGIKCEAVTLASAPLAQAASAAGSVDIVNSTIDTTLQAIAKGNDLQIFGGYWINNPYILIARADLPLPHKNEGYPGNMADLKGLKVGVTTRGSSAEIFVKALLREAGMPIDSVSYIPVGGPVTAYAAIVAKQVDAALSWDPVPALCEAAQTCSSIVDLRKGEGPASFKPLNSTTVFLQAQRQYISKHPDRIEAFKRALADAVVWIQDPKNADEVLAIAKKNIVLGESIPNREKVYELMVRDAIPHFTSSLVPSSIKAWHDFLLENKVIDKPLAVDTLLYKPAS
jgi:NitT/TauT family transport system substrate-binding protein